jgi:bacterioferritin-associated ferredoxin
MEGTRIVCDCMGVEADEVKKYLKQNPNSDLDEICDVLEISAACGCCREDKCSKIDISIIDLIKELRA